MRRAFGVASLARRLASRAAVALALDGRRVAVQPLAHELAYYALDKIRDGAAQLVTNERLQRLRRRCHGLSLRPFLAGARLGTPATAPRKNGSA